MTTKGAAVSRRVVYEPRSSFQIRSILTLAVLSNYLNGAGRSGGPQSPRGLCEATASTPRRPVRAGHMWGRVILTAVIVVLVAIWLAAIWFMLTGGLPFWFKLG